MFKLATITAEEALDQLLPSPGEKPAAAIDVRSEGEFARAGIDGFTNLPILNDEERAQVGLCFRERGQTAAIELGVSLTKAKRGERVAGWRQVAERSPHGFVIVACWRGGLRSQFACGWLQGAGISTRRVEGGYQALRRELLVPLSQPPPLIVLGGLTGSGKTPLLQALQKEEPAFRGVDLEALANHRGSAFGAYLQGPGQPRQTWFENRLAARLRKVTSPVLIEDESARIGEIFLPPAFLAAKDRAPRVLLEEPLERRTMRIIEEYVSIPLAQGVGHEKLHESLARSIYRLRRSLGGALGNQLDEELRLAFRRGGAAAHEGWVRQLLEHYYDRTYRHSLSRSERRVLFKGDWQACREWIAAQARASWPALLA